MSPTLTDSGNLIPTDPKAKAIQNETMRLNVPSPRSIPFLCQSAEPAKTDASMRLPLPRDAQIAETQHVRVDDAHRTFIAVGNEWHSILRCASAGWLAFLFGIDPHRYSRYGEGVTAPDLARHNAIIDLLQAQRLQLWQSEEGLFLVPLPVKDMPKPSKIAGKCLTCAELAVRGQWDTALCCEECHANPEQYLIEDNLKIGDGIVPTWQSVSVCCRVPELIDDWYPGKVYGKLPVHDGIEERKEAPRGMGWIVFVLLVTIYQVLHLLPPMC